MTNNQLMAKFESDVGKVKWTCFYANNVKSCTKLMKGLKLSRKHQELLANTMHYPGCHNVKGHAKRFPKQMYNI